MTAVQRMWAVIATLGVVSAGAPATALADPPPFPDLSALGAVNASDYALQLPNSHPHDPSNAIYFLASGVPCNFHTGGVGCTGNIPGVPDSDKGPFTTVASDTGIQAAGSTPYGDGTVQGQPIKALGPGQSIFVSGTRCGVDPAGVVACKDFQGRGFVISPQGTTWLPHV